jgi:hypothetical protein
MLTFKQYLMEFFLNEAVLNAKYSSKDGQRHIEKYIKPYLPKGDLHAPDTHTLEKAHGDLPKGTKLTLTGFHVDEKTGKTHVTARHSGSKKEVSIPASSIRKPSQKDGRHNEEHAVMHVWNHFSSKGGEHPSVEDMHAEIEKAKTDRNHPLHIRHRADHEFSGKISGNNKRVGTKESRKQAKQTYYQNLRDAAHTVHALANHRDFRSHWKNKDKIEHAGKAKPELSEHYKSKGVRGAGATSKGDALIIRSSKGGSKGVKALSFKKTGGSQLMSSSPAEFHAIYHHALKQMKKDSHQNLKKLETARNHMEKGEHEKANKIVQDLHEKHPHLIHHVTHEALTGNGKFANPEGRATHVASIGKDAQVWTTDDFMYDHRHEISKLRPRVRGSKHGGTKSTVSLDTPKKKKTDTNRE